MPMRFGSSSLNNVDAARDMLDLRPVSSPILSSCPRWGLSELLRSIHLRVCQTCIVSLTRTVDTRPSIPGKIAGVHDVSSTSIRSIGSDSSRLVPTRFVPTGLIPTDPIPLLPIPTGSVSTMSPEAFGRCLSGSSWTGPELSRCVTTHPFGGGGGSGHPLCFVWSSWMWSST